MKDLASKKCVPCEGGVPSLQEKEIGKYLSQLKNTWDVEGNKKIRHEFRFKNFVEAMQFVNKIAHMAEEEGHHPNIYISYNKVVIELWTHAIDGLSLNDFILAAKIEDV